MEEELIQSMKRNLQRHLKEEDAEGFDWTQWQAEKLNSIARYRAQNRKIIGSYISTIPQQIEDMIRQSYETGKQQEEIRILKAIRQGYLAAAGSSGEIGTGFFAVNERKLNALVKATKGEMHKAVSSILRYQDDIYRQTIFRSAAQFNMGGRSLGQAVDAAVQDFLAQGIRNIRYKDGRYVNIASYAEMALRTANLRANIQGEAAKRDEWGICTVKLSAHGSACPKCIPWQGKVYYDDVYGSVPVPKDGKYPLLSTAIAGGALHPNCKNGVHTWFEGINQPPKEMTQEEIDEANRRYDLEQQQRYCERNVRKYKRLKLGAIDPENAAKYAAQEQAWRKRLNSLVKENSDVLRIDYRRLKVYDAPAPPAGKTTAVPPTPKPKAAKAKAYTEGVPAGHAVEVTPPATKDNGGSGKTYRAEKIGGKSLTSGADSGIIEAERPMAAKTFEKAAEYAKSKLGLSIEKISDLPVEKVNQINNMIWRIYREVPVIRGSIDEVLLEPMKEIAAASFRWNGDTPQFRLKLSRELFSGLSMKELEDNVQACVESGYFTPKDGLYGVFKHEAMHFAEYIKTLEKYHSQKEAVKKSLDEFELAKQIMHTAFVNCELDETTPVIENYLGEYAVENPAEFIAEAFSSTDDNVLVNEVKRLLFKKWGIQNADDYATERNFEKRKMP